MRIKLIAIVASMFLPCEAATAAESIDELTHEALFAPNLEFPYFKEVNQLSASRDSFDVETAATLAQFSMLAYVKDYEFISKTLDEAGYPDTRFFESAGTFGFIAYNDAVIVLAFRGTESADKIDYATDSKIFHVTLDGIGKAHGGFVEALAEVEREISGTLEELAASRPRKFFLTGHSLGGALATLFAIRTNTPVEALYTIGSPRVGNKEFATFVDEKVTAYRIVNDNDFVARIPPPPFYEHAGATCFINTDGELLIDPESLAKWKQRFRGHQKFIKKLWRDHWSEGDFDAIPSDYFVDHSPRLYVEALLKLSSE